MRNTTRFLEKTADAIKGGGIGDIRMRMKLEQSAVRKCRTVIFEFYEKESGDVLFVEMYREVRIGDMISCDVPVTIDVNVS